MNKQKKNKEPCLTTDVSTNPNVSLILFTFYNVVFLQAVGKITCRVLRSNALELLRGEIQNCPKHREQLFLGEK